MIDIHAHILPGIDDGAADLETALQMAEIAAAGGIDAIIATPHVISGVSTYNAHDIMEAVGNLNLHINRRGIPVKILPGAEYYLEPDLPGRYAGGELLTLNGSQYLLVELPPAQAPAYTRQVLYELQLQGLIPVIAHPERNYGFIREPEVLGGLIKRGSISQITTASLTGLFGRLIKKTAIHFLRRGWGHVIASDAHSCQRRIPELLTAEKELKKIGGDGFCRSLLVDNPGSIAEGKPLAPLHPLSDKSRFLQVLSRLF